MFKFIKFRPFTKRLAKQQDQSSSQDEPPFVLRFFVPVLASDATLPEKTEFYLEIYDGLLSYDKVIKCISSFDEDFNHPMWKIEQAMDSIYSLDDKYKSLFTSKSLVPGLELTFPVTLTNSVVSVSTAISIHIEK